MTRGKYADRATAAQAREAAEVEAARVKHQLFLAQGDLRDLRATLEREREIHDARVVALTADIAAATGDRVRELEKELEVQRLLVEAWKGASERHRRVISSALNRVRDFTFKTPGLGSQPKREKLFEELLVIFGDPEKDEGIHREYMKDAIHEKGQEEHVASGFGRGGGSVYKVSA
jgi:hypothetical protein